MDDKMTFSAILAKERQDAGYSIHDVARGVSVPKEVYETWEKGQVIPTRSEYSRLCAHFRKLRHHPPPVFSEVSPPHRLPPATPRQTFGICLREEREREGMDQDEVGALLGVTGQAVSSWELDKAPPVRENYEKLLVLFLRLREAPKPDWRDIPVPDGGRGVPRSDYSPSSTTSLEPDMSTTPSAPPLTHRMAVPSPSIPTQDPTKLSTEDLTEHVMRGYIKVFGGGWVMKTTIENNEYVVSMSSDADRIDRKTKGKGVRECLLDLRKWLNEEINKRIAELEALRRTV